MRASASLSNLISVDEIADLLAFTVRKLGADVEKSGRKAIWDTLEAQSDTEFIDDRSFADMFAGVAATENHTMTFTVRTIDPKEIA